MSRYYTLVSIDYTDEFPQWAIEFGDYDRDCVEDERLDMADHPAREPSQRFKIISSGDSQAEINDAVAALNAKLPKPNNRQCRHCDNPAVPGYGNCYQCGEECGGDF